MAAALEPATLLGFHRALKARKDRHLFSPQRRGKPGPKGPSKELIQAIDRDIPTQASLDGNTPAERSGSVVTHPVGLRKFTWEKHCGGLSELPVAA